MIRTVLDRTVLKRKKKELSQNMT